jgi:hypothetical protein
LPDDPAAKAVTVNTDPAQEQEWLRQNNLIYGGLIGIGVVLVQPFLTAVPPPGRLDTRQQGDRHRPAGLGERHPGRPVPLRPRRLASCNPSRFGSARSARDSSSSSRSLGVTW